MIGSFFFLATRSFKNRLISRLSRLRRPRYLISTILGLAYFGMILRNNRPSGISIGDQPLLLTEVILVLGGVIVLMIFILAWGSPKSSAGLEFSDAEIQFLFPAPFGRAGLLLYKIIRAQPAILLSSVILSLFVARHVRFPGLWLTLVVIDVYALMTALGRARLKQIGVGFLARLIGVTVVLALVVIFAARAFDADRRQQMKDALFKQDVRAGLSIAGQTLRTQPLASIVFVPGLFGRALTADTPVEMATTTLSLLGLGVLFFLIANRLDVSVEDASLEASKRKADQLERQDQMRRGARVTFKRVPPLFRLGESGRSEIAIVWKNLIAAGRIAVLPVLLIALAIIGSILMIGMRRGSEAFLMGGGFTCLMFAGMMVVMGPMMVRSDLRGDFERMDVLKSWPMSGKAIVGSQIASSALIVSAVQLLFLILALAMLRGPLAAEDWARLAAWAPAVIVITIPINIVQVTMHNALVILLPGWAVTAKEEMRGPEAMGRGLLMILTNFIVLFLAVLPAAIAFAATFWLAHFIFGYGPAAGFLAVVPGVMLLAGEIALALQFLGAQFEELDIANDVTA